jgi:hypothetical protein
MVATLLDPKCKSLSFASELQRIRVKNILREKVEETLLRSILPIVIDQKGIMKLMNI